MTIGLIFSVLSSVAAAEQATAESVLVRYIDCLSIAPLHLDAVQKRPISPPYRPLQVDGLLRMVSVIAGYSVSLATTDGVPVFDVKLELSDPTVADRDRDIVRSQMRAMSDRRPRGAQAISEWSIGGVEILALHESDLSRPVTSFYTLFVKASSAIVSIYVRGILQTGGVSPSPMEFIKARDDMVGAVAACLE